MSQEAFQLSDEELRPGPPVHEADSENGGYEIEKPSQLEYVKLSPDSVTDYLRAIGRVPLLAAHEEVELSKSIEAGVFAATLLSQLESKEIDLTDLPVTATPDELELLAEEGQKAKKHMLEANLRLVVNIAKRHTHRGLAFQDLIQEGNIGLVRAVEKFDYAKGFKFSTYATWWIRQSISRALADQSHTIRVPVHMVEKINKIARFEREMVQELGREPTVVELAAVLKMEPASLKELQGYGRNPISLDLPIGDGNESRLGDIIEDDQAPQAEQTAEFYDLRHQEENLLSQLTEREADIIRRRMGFIGGRPQTLDETGHAWGITRERARQLEKQAFDTLRKLGAEDKLRDYLQNL